MTRLSSPAAALPRRLLLGLPALFAARFAHGQAFPEKPIKIVVAYAPGGAADVMARGVAQEMAKRLGVSVLVENRSGATGAIGAQVVATATPDGHTLLFASGSEISVQPLVQKALPYNVERDFVPISLIGTTPIVLAVNSKLAAANLPELIALGRQRTLSFASSGTGTVNHLTGEFFAARAGLRLLHVPYRGTGQAVNDVASGQVDMIFAGLPAVLPMVASGQIRLLAVSTAERSAAAPEIPTLAELGFAGFDMSNWFGLMAPTGTSAAILEKLGDAARAAAGEADVQALFRRLGGDARQTTADQYRDFIAAERMRLTEAVKVARIEPN